MRIITTILLAATLFTTLPSCTDNNTTIRILKQHGFIKIKTKGYAWHGCSENDTYKTKFSAYNPKTKTWTQGIVCCGMLFKGCTIRYY